MRNNNGLPDKATIVRLRAEYPAGCRVELAFMDDPFAKLSPGERGSVRWVDDIGTIHVDWDCGSGLGVAYGADSVRKLQG